MTATSSFRRGAGPQRVGVPAKMAPLRAQRAVVVNPGQGAPLRLPRMTTARGVRRANARLIDWVLDGRLDSLVATRISYMLENIRKAIELEQLAVVKEKLDELIAEGKRCGIDMPAMSWDGAGDHIESNAATDIVGEVS